MTTTNTFTDQIIGHKDIASFAADHVNLKRDDAAEYRAQVNRLREKLQGFISEHPDLGLIKLLLNGSLAKGLALKTLNDIDVALYVDAERVPDSNDDLLDYLVDKLREAYPQKDPADIKRTTHCVQITFRGTGLTVDVAPVYAIKDDDDDHGYLINKDTGARVLTSIPRHLRFTRGRKDKQPDHYAQVVRLMKWWVRQRKLDDDEFRMKSFMSELVVAHLADAGQSLADYPSALSAVFVYLMKSRLKQRVAFADYYPASKLPGPTGAVIEVFDPVNCENNVAGDYSDQVRQRILENAEDALDAIAEARYATTKARAVECWQRVLGPSFRG
ncbi:MAG: nucleotidyltransferase [Phycisphaerae bacterium]|nr:nucleotidyltransferase [Phycisphaerae bacterium]